MRAARFHQWDAPPAVDEVPEPVRAAGQVLVEVHAGAVAHLDVTVAGGKFAMHPDLPYIGGVEGAGVVLESDADSGLEPGCQVLLRGGGLGLLRDGTWAERVTVPTKAVTRLDSPLSPEVAATFFQPATTAYVVLHDVARLEADEEVIVVGAAGAVGSMVAQQARLAGAKVTGVVTREDQLSAVPSGVEAISTTSPEDVAMLAETRSASLLVDTLGGEGLVGRTRWVRQGGRAVAVGYVLGAEVSLDLASWLLDDVALVPVNMIRRERRARELAGQLVKRLSAGELQVDVQKFDLAEAGLALEQLRAGRLRGRAVLTPAG